MGVDISFIIPNKLRSMRKHKENVHYLDDTITQVVRYFRGRERFVSERFVEREDIEGKASLPEDEYSEYSFNIPLLDAKLELHNAYWDIETYVDYAQYFLYWKDENGKKRVGLRETCFDIARILGYDEAWVCDEHHSWDNSIMDNLDATFDDWLKCKSLDDDGSVYEYEISNMKDRAEEGWPNYKAKYHDAFKECKELLCHYQQVFPTYEILTISQLGDYVLAAQGYELYLLNVDTGERLTDFPIDGCDDNLNGGGIVIYKGNKSALFRNDGKQITPFRKGTFSWDWYKSGNNPFYDIIITDEATGRKYISDGSEIEEPKNKHRRK